MDEPQPRWTTLPAPIRVADTTATHPTLERPETTPDQHDLERSWIGHWYA